MLLGENDRYEHAQLSSNIGNKYWDDSLQKKIQKFTLSKKGHEPILKITRLKLININTINTTKTPSKRLKTSKQTIQTRKETIQTTKKPL